MNTSDNGHSSLEIDVLYLLKKIWHKKVLIIFSTVLFGLLALIVSVFILKPTFTSSTRIYVVSQSAENNITSQDLQAGTYLVNDYKEIITSDSVLSEVINREGLTLSTGALRKMLVVTIPSDTRIITISVNNVQPQSAQQLATASARLRLKRLSKLPRWKM